MSKIIINKMSNYIAEQNFIEAMELIWDWKFAEAPGEFENLRI